jgi:transglutaminase-like putative cysteine protease
VPHEELTITGRATVDTVAEAPSEPGATWRDVVNDDVADELCEYLLPTRSVPNHPSLDQAAAELRSVSTPAEAVEAAADWTRRQLVYERGATNVATSAVEAWSAGRGVCQDFVHLTLGVVRAMGVPARYVSGYLHQDPDAAPGDISSGESHAWVEAWVGTWVPIDPTNGLPVADRHVRVARGADYHDVAPVRGIYSGRHDHVEQAVSVQLTRLG